MAKTSHLLTDIQIRQWIKGAEPVAKSDGDGLTFTLSAAGTAAWVLRFRHGGRRHELTLGRYPDLTLTAARKLASEKRVDVQQDRNPALDRRKAKTRRDWTVRELIQDYRDLVLCELADSTQRSYGRNLDRIQSGMGAMAVRDVSAADVVAQIERVKVGWVESFTLWCALRGIFKHASGKRLIDVSPCAGVQLDSIIGKRPAVQKRLMLTDEELHILLNAEMSNENRLSVSVLLATGVRASELFTARRSDLHLDEARWHIPKSKTDASMDIPLAPAVVRWFKKLLDLGVNSEYVLPARSSARMERLGGDAHLSKDALREAIDFWIENHEPKIRRFTPHDLRATMKSHMRKLGVGRDISEMCLNHKLPGVEGIYDQHNYYDERRAALELWASFLTTCQAGKKWKVTPLRRSAA